MARIIGCALLLAAAAFAGKALVSFRVKGDEGPPLRGWCLECTADGFVFARFGGGRRDFISWDLIEEEDAMSLRRRFNLELDEDEKRGLIAGHRLHLVGGGTVEGVLVRVDMEERHWLRSRGCVLPYPKDRILSVEATKVKEAEVYDPHETYLRRLERLPPTSARQHRDLADRMFDIGDFEKAAEHYEIAIARMPSWRAALSDRLEEIRSYIEDAEVRAVLQKAKAVSSLHGKHDEARALLNAFMEAHPDRRRLALRVLDQVEQRRFEEMRERFHRVKTEELDRTVRDYVVRRAPDIDEAMSWVTAKLEKMILEGTRERLGLTREEMREFLGTKADGAPHWASYWTGSFILSSRAKTGKHTAKEPIGDKDRWWDAYSDVGPRVNFLRAYAAERLPRLFEVVQVRTPPCDKCGGTGQTRHTSVHPLEALGGGHEYSMRCARCYGACQDRVVGFR